MGLRIVSEQLQSAAEPNIPPDEYPDRLRKYIPTETVSFWLAISSTIQSASDNVPKVGLLWFFFVIGLVFTFGWTRRRTKEPNKPTAWTQIALSCGAFLVWVVATGGSLTDSIPFYHPLYGSLLLITYTTGVAFVIPPEK
ncbi:MAG: hypothetical protein HC936_07675 [Leptolyngbyaceae cyanobacterium SU_3_3]|nr:hypothetical protein [Leptolyngbyaceae cyanobacterium SU_3_3]